MEKISSGLSTTGSNMWNVVMNPWPYRIVRFSFALGVYHHFAKELEKNSEVTLESKPLIKACTFCVLQLGILIIPEFTPSLLTLFSKRNFIIIVGIATIVFLNEITKKGDDK